MTAGKLSIHLMIPTVIRRLLMDLFSPTSRISLPPCGSRSRVRPTIRMHMQSSKETIATGESHSLRLHSMLDQAGFGKSKGGSPSESSMTWTWQYCRPEFPFFFTSEQLWVRLSGEVGPAFSPWSSFPGRSVWDGPGGMYLYVHLCWLKVVRMFVLKLELLGSSSWRGGCCWS